jgi:hypothetical protein
MQKNDEYVTLALGQLGVGPKKSKQRKWTVIFILTKNWTVLVMAHIIITNI